VRRKGEALSVAAQTLYDLMLERKPAAERTAASRAARSRRPTRRGAA
jgi:hypothetical protein